MADTEKTVTPEKATIPEVDLTKYKVSQARIYGPLTKKNNCPPDSGRNRPSGRQKTH